MSDVIGRGVIEVVADARKLKASIEDAKKSLRTLGEGQKDISAGASQSIDKYIGRLQAQNATIGKSARETELYKLALRGASNEQLNAADAALKFAESQDRAQAVLGGLKAGLIAVGIAAAAAFATKTISTIEFLDRINDLSKATGIAVEDLAGLSLLAKQTGTDLDGLAKGINKMSVELGKDPGKFRELGVTATDSVGAFKQLADIFNKIPDISLRNALAQKVFSKSWQELAPALSEGSKGIGEAIEKGARLSGITKEMAKQADEFNDRLAELKISSAAFGADFIPTLTKIVNLLITGKAAAAEFFGRFAKKSDNDELTDVEKRLADAQSNPLANSGAFRSANRGQIAALERERDRLRVLVDAKIPELSSHLTPQQDSAAEAARAKAARDASARASKFLAEPKNDGASQARAEAAAQLQFDLDQIKKAGDATISAFANAEKIMEAMRSAALVDDRDYYEAKRGFIVLNAQTEEAELRAQIKRLNEEEFTGKTAAKDRLNRDREVAAREAQITRVQEGAVAGRIVLGVQETDSNKKIAQSYLEMTTAAAAYITSIEARNALELAGIGKGDRFRDQQSGMAEIKAKLLAETARLQIEKDRGTKSKEEFDKYLAVAQQTYEKEVELYLKRTESIRASEADWTNGAREALAKYYDEARNIAKQTEDAFTRAFSGLEDALVEFAKTGKLNFKSLADSIITDIIRIQIKSNITGPLAKLLQGGIGGLLGGGGGNSFYGSVDPSNFMLGSNATGTDFVPQTGLYQLHRGEAVITAAENARGGGGGDTFHFHFAMGVGAEVRSEIQANQGRFIEMARAAVRDDRNRTGDAR